MKNKKKRKNVKNFRFPKSETVNMVLICLLAVLFLANTIQLSITNKSLNIQAETVIQISDFLQNRFEIERPNERMTEVPEVKL